MLQPLLFLLMLAAVPAVANTGGCPPVTYTFIAEGGEAFPGVLVEVTMTVNAGPRLFTTPPVRGEPGSAEKKLFCFAEQYNDGEFRGDIWVKAQ